MAKRKTNDALLKESVMTDRVAAKDVDKCVKRMMEGEAREQE